MIVDSTNPRIMADNIRELARNGGGSGSSGVSHYKVTSGEIEGTFAEVLADLTAGKLVCLDVYSDGILAVTYFRDGLFTSEEETLTELGFYAIANKIQKGVLSSDGSFTLSRSYPLVSDYSTSEKNTGRKWIDGKDIYQKTIVIDDFSEMTTGTTHLNTINHSIENIGVVVDYSGIYAAGSDTLSYSALKNLDLSLSGSYSWTVSVFDINSTNFSLMLGASIKPVLNKLMLTVSYTKSGTTETKKTTKRKTTKGEN